MKKENKKEEEEKVTLDNYNSLNDYLFYKYMCEEGNEKQQKTFLKAIGVPIKGELKIKNETIAPEIINRKKCILDFLTETNDTLINIELQQQDKTDFKDRIAYYMSKLTRLEKGNDYNVFKKVLIITIVNFKMNNLQNYKQEYKIVNIKDPTDIFTEKVHIITIELKKFKKIEKNLNNREHLYLSFIDKETDHNQRKEMGKMDEGLKSAVKKLEDVLQSEEQLRIYHKVELEKTIAEKEKLRTEEKIKQGVEKGRKEGIKKEKMEIAIELKKMGLDIEKIAKVTKLSTDFIEKL